MSYYNHWKITCHKWLCYNGTLLHIVLMVLKCVNTLRPRHNGRHFADAIFKCIFLNENICIPIKISLKLVPEGPINYIPALVQIMAWRRPGDKPLSETMMVSLLTHICVTQPQWVNEFNCFVFVSVLVPNDVFIFRWDKHFQPAGW